MFFKEISPALAARLRGGHHEDQQVYWLQLTLQMEIGIHGSNHIGATHSWHS